MPANSQPRSYRHIRVLLSALLLAFAGGVIGPLVGEDPAAKPQTSKEALQSLNGLIGEWRGVGQPRRQSNKGAWTEQAGWVWDLAGDEPAIVQQVTDGKLLKQVRIQFDPAAAEYVIATTSPADDRVVYRGRWEKGQLVAVAPGDAQQPTQRITITPHSDIRMLELLEATEPGKSVYFRVAEIGYTRKGQRLAGPGGGQPQCVVTGGLGTIEVQYKGETYYVCCTGCQQAFNDDPEGILKEYRARLQAERAKGAQ
jgi:hypothetical protein